MTRQAIPQRGDFQWLGMSGAFEPSIAGMSDARGYFGLVPEASYYWGTFRDATGRVFIFMRRLPFHGLTEAPKLGEVRSTIGRRAVLFDQNEAGEIGVHPASMNTAHNTDVVTQVHDDRVVWQVAGQGERRRGLHAVYRPDRLEYREDGLVEVTGTSLRPGLQWYLPGRDKGLFYASQTFDCAGTIAGVPVTGFLFLEQAYMNPQSVLYAVNDVLMGEETHLTWYSFATIYEDGSYEFGHFIVGHDRLGIGIVAGPDGLIVQSSTVSARTTRAADGWSERVDLDVDGQPWEVIQPRSLRILPTIHTGNRQQEGIVRRVGEGRRPARYMAWGETAHGDERVHRYLPQYRPA